MLLFRCVCHCMSENVTNWWVGKGPEINSSIWSLAVIENKSTATVFCKFCGRQCKIQRGLQIDFFFWKDHQIPPKKIVGAINHSPKHQTSGDIWMPRDPSKRTSTIFQESVGADVVETAFQLLFLLVFALVCSWLCHEVPRLLDGGWSN